MPNGVLNCQRNNRARFLTYGNTCTGINAREGIPVWQDLLKALTTCYLILASFVIIVNLIKKSVMKNKKY